GRIYMNSDSVLTIKEGAKIEAEFIHTIKNVRIELKGTEVLRNSSGTSSAGLLLNNGSTPTIYVSETNTIRTVSMNDGANTINLELGFTGTEDFIAFNDIYSTNTSTNVDVIFNVKNFENNRIKIQLSTNSLNSGLLSGNVLLNTFNETSGNYESADVNLVATGVSGVYWLNVAVPEPAEWAMILGSLALGFAMYRRRK
ncbi:MAG: PEP-CTERM sorting domain-containing protein, partial [Opitutales bacterium]|nr:PEP-CTERM sorting domain-containing protein [Opitutales bacterium]